MISESSVSEFFQIYSDRSEAPLEMLDCLTFSFVFADEEVLVVNQGSSEDWEKLQELADILLNLYTHKKSRKLLVTIEIGNCV